MGIPIVLPLLVGSTAEEAIVLMNSFTEKVDVEEKITFYNLSGDIAISILSSEKGISVVAVRQDPVLQMWQGVFSELVDDMEEAVRCAKILVRQG